MEKVKSFEAAPSEESKKPEISAERIGEVRKFVESARALGLEPRGLIKQEIKETRLSKKWEQMPPFLKWFNKVTFPIELLGGDPKTVWQRLEYQFTYNSIMGNALLKAGVIKGKWYGELSAQSFLEAQRDPSKIIDPEKYKQVFEATEVEFLAGQTEPVDLKKMTEALEKATQERQEEKVP